MRNNVQTHISHIAVTMWLITDWTISYQFFAIADLFQVFWDHKKKIAQRMKCVEQLRH